MSDKFSASDIIKLFNIRPTKSLGQNFLNNMNVVREIVSVAELSRDDAVIEVGPGLGVMTELLAEQAGMVAAVEIDAHLMDILNTLKNTHENIEIINADILKIDIKRDILTKYFTAGNFKNVKVVANLPYYITTPIIMNFLEGDVPGLKRLVFMVQKEVAERMTAMPGGKEYGALSVAVGYFAEGKIEFNVPPSSFIPRPSVDSSVVCLNIRENPPFELKDKDYFFKVVKAAFGQRRKMLSNALANAPYLGVTKENVFSALEYMDKDYKIRGETLAPTEFAKLADFLYALKTI